MTIRNKMVKSVIIVLAGILITPVSVISMADEVVTENDAVLDNSHEIAEGEAGTETVESETFDESETEKADANTIASETSSIETVETLENAEEEITSTELITMEETISAETNRAETDFVETTVVSESGEKEDVLSSAIVGTWSVDEITFIKFGKGEKGCLILPDEEFSFTYKVKDDQLTLKFASSRASDGTYTASVSDDELFLEGGVGTIGSSLYLEKVEK